MSIDIKNKILYRFGMTVNVIVLSCLGVVAYWLFQPVDYFIGEQPLQVVHKQLRVGENIEYIVKYCKNTHKVPVQVKRQLVDGYAYDLPESTSTNFPEGCHTVSVDIPLAVPSSVRAGVYHLLITGTYQVNPIRQWSYTLVTEDFEIIK
jgi:hypothetical protein